MGKTVAHKAEPGAEPPTAAPRGLCRWPQCGRVLAGGEGSPSSHKQLAALLQFGTEIFPLGRGCCRTFWNQRAWSIGVVSRFCFYRASTGCALCSPWFEKTGRKKKKGRVVLSEIAENVNERQLEKMSW